MKCEKCGTKIKGDLCAKNPTFKKWFIAIAVILVITITAGCSSTGQTPTPSAGQSEPAASEGENKPAASEGESKPAAEDNVYQAGESFEANGLKITFDKAEKWESSNQFLQPEDGKMYIRLHITAENTGSVDRYLSSFEFKCYADDAAADSAYLGEEELAGATLSQGRKSSGYIYFEVPKNAKNIEVEYETSFWTDKKAILKVELN